MDVTTKQNNNVTTQRPRRITLNLRITPEEKKEIERCASILGMSYTELVLSGVQIISGVIEKHKRQRETERHDQS